jgi:hypothetical protein
MTTLQTQALNNLIWIVSIFPLTALFTLVDVRLFGRPFSIENVSQIFLLFTLGVLVPLGQQNFRIYRIRKEGEKIWFDERDQMVNYKAIMYAYCALWIFMVFGFMFSCVFLGEIESIPFYILPLCLSSTVLIFALVYSIAILIQYGLVKKDGSK